MSGEKEVNYFAHRDLIGGGGELEPSFAAAPRSDEPSPHEQLQNLGGFRQRNLDSFCDFVTLDFLSRLRQTTKRLER